VIKPHRLFIHGQIDFVAHRAAQFRISLLQPEMLAHVRFCAAVGGQADIKYALAELPDL